MSGQVEFGLSNVHYAVWDAEGGTDKAGAYKTPIAIKGAVKLTLDAEGDTDTFYADNTAYFVSSVNGGYSGKLTIAHADKQLYVDLLGWELDDNGTLVEPADADSASFALMYEANGDPKKQRGVLYNVKLSRPSVEKNTTEDKSTPDTLEFEFNAVTRDFDYKGEKRGFLKASVETGDSKYEDFMKAVVLPSKAAV